MKYLKLKEATYIHMLWNPGFWFQNTQNHHYAIMPISMYVFMYTYIYSFIHPSIHSLSLSTHFVGLKWGEKMGSHQPKHD